MKKILAYIALGVFALSAGSCKKYLDINDNPNDPTSATPALVLPQALVGTGSLNVTYNSAFTYPGGFFSNVFGFGAYGPTVTVNYGATNFTGLWSSSYDNALDYQYVLDNTASNPALIYSNAVARIMKAFVFSKLVDQYNDVPYSEALKGNALLTPKYDKAQDIYRDLVAQLNTAIANIITGQSSNATSAIAASADPMFGGDMNRWKRFANSLKLRLLVKMAPVSELSSFARTEFAAFNNSIGIITDDALVNPGYVKQSGRLNPTYNLLAADENNNRRQTSALPTIWIYSFYDGQKLSDPGRGSVIFRNFPNTQKNQLGQDNLASTVIPPAGSTAWYTGTDFNTPGLGVAKGPSQGQVIMLLAEAQFLKAEAIARGYLTSGSAKTEFQAGVRGSFAYLFKNQSDVVDPSKDVTAAVTKYYNDNALSPLVNFDLATTVEQQVEAIITQKYIAMNAIACDEAFAEYRRTDYPKVVKGSTNPLLTFASLQSVATSPDRLITRIAYPQSEYNLNGSNVPQNVNLYTAKIFWDLN